MKAKCDKCGYEWETKSKFYYVSCPNCLGKVRIRKKEKLIIDISEINKEVQIMFKRKEYISWKKYKAAVDFVDLYKFQQKVRNENVRCKRK